MSINIIASIVSFAVTIGINFFLTPYLVKELGSNGRHHYAVSGKSKNNDYEQRLRKIFRESVTSYAVAQNIIVIKTLPGLANAACATS